MHVMAGDIITFTGKLAKRQWKPVQKFIQLVFETSHGPRISLTRDVEMAKDLTMHGLYHVQGQEYDVNGKIYINEPVVVGAHRKPSKQPGILRRHLKLSIAMAVCVPVLGLSTTAFLLTHHTTNNSQIDSGSNLSGKQQVIHEDNTSGQVLGASTQGSGEDANSLETSQQADTTADANTSTGTTVTKTTSAVPTPSPAPAPSPTPAPVPPPAPSPPPVAPPPPPPAAPASPPPSPEPAPTTTTNTTQTDPGDSTAAATPSETTTTNQ
jgi:hypothetical protein